MQKNLTYTLDSWALGIIAPQLDKNIYLLDKLFWETVILFSQNEEAHYAQDLFGLPLSLVNNVKNDINPSFLAQKMQLSFAPITSNIKEYINNILSNNHKIDDLDVSEEAYAKYRRLVRLYCLTVHRAVMENKNNLELLEVKFGISTELSQSLTRLTIAHVDKLANSINLKYRLRYNHSTLKALLDSPKNIANDHFFLFQRIAQSLTKVSTNIA